MKRKIQMALLALLVNVSSSFAQQVLDATVVAVLPYGQGLNVYFLHETNNSEYYKSVVTDVVLTTNDVARIWIPANEDGLFLVEDGIGGEFLAQKTSNPSTQLPLDLSLLLPSVINEILFFDSPEHLSELYKLTEEYTNQFEDNDDYQIYLNSIEELFGLDFISYRKYFTEKYPIDGSYSDHTISQMHQENFISDDIMSTYFNQFRLIGIGDTVYYYNNRKEILAVHEGNEVGIEYLEYLAREKDSDPEFDIFSDVSGMDLEYKQIDYISKKGDKVSAKGITYTEIAGGEENGYYFQTIVEKIDEVGECAPNVKGINVEFWYGVAGSTNSNINYYTNGSTITSSTSTIIRTVKLKINWGDGTWTTVYNNYTDLETIYHTYPLNPGQEYNVVVETEFYDLYALQTNSVFDGAGYPGSSPIKFNVGIACTKEDTQKYKEKVSNDGNWKMVMSGWTSDNVFGSEIGGYTHAYKKQNDGSWKLDKAKVKIEVEGTFRKESDCDITEYKNGDKEHNNDKKVQKTKSKVFGRYNKFGNGDVNTKHRLIKGNITLEDQIILNPC
jgi:hypothetical protein